jgi:hypothetical protein
MSIDTSRVRQHLNSFDFRNLFVEELGWSRPLERQKASIEVGGNTFERAQIAQLSGVVVFELSAQDGAIPDAKTRRSIHTEISKSYHENLLIFVDRERTQSLWYWVKRESGKSYPREHLYMRGQPIDLLLSKINAMVFDVSEFDEMGNVPVVEVANRLKKALDVERVTKKFYKEFQEQHLTFLELIKGIRDERQRRWYASVLLNRLMFIYFLQRKGFLYIGKQPQPQEDYLYLQKKLEDSRSKGKNLYYREFLQKLFFVGFAKPDEDEQKKDLKSLLGDVPYLNGGLFLQHKIEIENLNIQIPDQAFENLYKLFASYSWNLDDTPGGQADEINPDVLGYIFEKYINQKAFGAYYTRPEITQYLCEQTIYKLILERVNSITAPPKPTPETGNLFPQERKGLFNERRYDSMPDLLMNLDAFLCRWLMDEVLPDLKLLDPACGSAAFLVAAMKTLINVYSAIIGKIEFLGDVNLKGRLDKLRREHHGSIEYFIKKRIITENLFGVDIMEESTEIAKLRLFLALVASAKTREQLEPLPNIDFNILAGNALIGLMHVDDKEFDKRNAQGNLFMKSYRDLVRETANDIRVYRQAAEYNKDLRSLRDNIERKKREVTGTLNEILLNQFTQLGIKFEQATWDEKKNKEGKPQKRAVKLADIEALHPFHWGFEFDEVINKNGGFDAIITNPPWEIFKPISKEFCYDIDPTVERRGTDIKDFEKKLAELLKVPENRERYVEYLSQFPHVSAYFRQAKQYENQISVINGKKTGTDINLYKLFLEQCFNLLREGGECGIVLPSGVYSDLGTRQLREMLFTRSTITGLFCFENRREIFEGVHRSFKFVVLTFAKEGNTKKFPAAFMRHDVKDLEHFPRNDGMQIDVNLIRRLSPTSLSIIEFKTDFDVTIAEKMAKFPLLGERLDDKWNMQLTAEFHMTNDSGLFNQQPAKNRLPLYEGKMIWLFDHGLEEPRYWIDKDAGRIKLLSPRLKAIKKLLEEYGLDEDDFDEEDIILGYQSYRLGFRAVTGATNERALVVSVVPQNVFCGNSLIVSIPVADRIIEKGNIPKWAQLRMYTPSELLACVALMGSYVCDWFIRQKILTNMNMFYVYEIPVPRLAQKDTAFAPIVERAARLICTTSEFDDLAREVCLGSHKKGAANEVERARLRAELDGLIAHLYGLTEEEFAYILTTFPLVSETVKTAAQNAYRDVERGLIK